MKRSDLIRGDVWRVRLRQIAEGERQIVAMYATTVDLAPLTDATIESVPWGDVEFLSLVRHAQRHAPMVLP